MESLTSAPRERHTASTIQIGLLSPVSPDRPHFESLRRMLPPEVSVVNEGLGLLRDSYQNLAGQADEIVARAVDFVQRNPVQGLVLTGGFVTLFNPGLESKAAEAVRIPVSAAVSSVVAALRALSAARLILVTPFSADMNTVISNHLENEGFTVFSGPAFDKERKPGAEVKISPDDLMRKVAESVEANPTAQAIYFQGATLDPLPVIQRLEDQLRVPVVASNPAMIWNILSKIGRRVTITGYGTLLLSWPKLAD